MIKKIIKKILNNRNFFKLIFKIKFIAGNNILSKKILLKYTFFLSENGSVLYSIIIGKYVLGKYKLNFKDVDSLSTIFMLQGLSKKGMELKLLAKKLKENEIIDKGLQNLKYRIFTSNLFRPIGHLGLIDIFIKGEKVGLLEKKVNIIMGSSQDYSCPSLLEYWRRVFENAGSQGDKLPELVERNLSLFEANFEIFDNLEGGIYKLEEFGSKVQQLWELRERHGLLNLSDSDFKYGQERLQRMGVPKNAWFCGLHVRETSGALRDVRNADVSTYSKFCEEVSLRGGWVLRMGDASMNPVKLGGNFIDYVHSGFMNERMNLFLWASGLFFTGTGSGPANIPTCFGKPVLMTNIGPLMSRLWGGNILIMPKRYYSKNLGRDLNIEERLSNKYGSIESVEGLKTMGIEVINNTCEDLAGCAIEIINRIHHADSYSKDELEVINRFKNESEKRGVYPTQLCKESLKYFKSD